MKARCRVVRANGYRCINSAPDGQDVCANHNPERQCGARTVTGRPCKRMKMQGKSHCSEHPVDASGKSAPGYPRVPEILND